MIIVALFIVLLFLTFGFVFAKIDSLIKMCKILRDEISKLHEEIAEIKNKKNS